MVAESPDKQTCAGCGATFAANLRYCVDCYRPVASVAQARTHIEMARQVETTRRADPTVVFLPEAHEARLRRAIRRKRTVIVSVIVVLLTVTALGIWLAQTRQSQNHHHAMARTEMARRELRLMADGLERFRADVGRYPTSSEGIRGLMVRPAAFKPTDDQRANQWLGPYLDSLPEVDPWGNDYLYEVTEGGKGFRLYSEGPNGDPLLNSQLEVASPDSE